MDDAQRVWGLPSDRTAARLARDAVDGACGVLVERDRAAALLLVTELVTNAVDHGRGPILLVVVPEPRCLRVEVHDESSEMPQIGGPTVAVGVWAVCGLQLLAEFASSWGVSRRGFGQPGKLVWSR
ncbi:MAG: ATP-binding protein [Nocardioidaceae bacterium]|nr:ATP-binding protein [Nocardioidaceae bacterium]